MSADAARGPDTLSHRTYQALRREIATGQIRPGQRLVREEIAQRLGVSHMPVIEALLRLEQDGLAESIPNRGSRVKTVSLETVRNECVLREAIECQVARLVAEAAGSQSDRLASAARRLDRLMQRGDSGSEIGMELHMEFHLDLARLTGFELLREQLEAVWLRHLMQINWLNAALQPVPADWHQSLLAALGGGDPDTAERAMREHVRYGADHLARAVQELGGADARP